MEMPAEVTGEGRPLVMLGGGLTGSVSWAPFAEKLAPSRKVVRLQHVSVQLGLEGKPLPPDYSPRTEREALHEALESLRASAGIEPPVDFAGWSYGGQVVLDFALDHPEWVRSMTLIEPAAVWVLPSLDSESTLLKEEQQRFPTDEITEDLLEEFVEAVGLAPPGTDPRQLPQWPVWSQHRQSLRSVGANWTYERDGEGLRELQAPALLVKGMGSARWLHQIVDTLLERLPHAEVAEWPGGHGAHITNMDAFLERMAAFQARDQ